MGCNNKLAESNLCVLLMFLLYVYFRSNKALADSLDQAMDPQDPLVNRLLRVMATQAMSNALYFSTGSCTEDQYYHYGKVKLGFHSL